MHLFVFGDPQLGRQHRPAIRAHLLRVPRLSMLVHPGRAVGWAAWDEAWTMGLSSQHVARNTGETTHDYFHRLLSEHEVSVWLLLHQQDTFRRGGCDELLLAALQVLPGTVALLSPEGNTLHSVHTTP